MSKKLVETDRVCTTIAHTAILLFHGNFILTKQNMRPVGRVRREKKNPGLALCFQPRSRPFV